MPFMLEGRFDCLTFVDCRRCLPHLKSCMRGINWEDTHWAQLFALLGFKTGSLTKETVTLAHFLDRADTIITNMQQIKALDALVRCATAASMQGNSNSRKHANCSACLG